MESAAYQLFIYILDEFPKATSSVFVRDMVCNILTESEKIHCIAERCDWLAKMIPEVTVAEIRNILLR